MDVEIRGAEQSDMTAIAKLSSQLGYPTTSSEITQRLAHILADEKQDIFMAEAIDKVVVGWVHVFIAQRLIVDTYVEIGGLIVKDGQRGSGIGKALIIAAEAWAREHGVSEMRVRSNVIREKAQKFYERLGYSCVKQQNVYYKKIE
jgi:N-acetylglutamate synthase-like GNAT family acetyltransferase